MEVLTELGIYISYIQNMVAHVLYSSKKSRAREIAENPGGPKGLPLNLLDRNKIEWRGLNEKIYV